VAVALEGGTRRVKAVAVHLDDQTGLAPEKVDAMRSDRRVDAR
jgi:hypothetical protein